MAAVLYLMVYLLCGMAIVQFLLPAHKPLTRWWLGLSLGLFLLMWLPALAAFFIKFSHIGHYAALAPLVALTGGAYYFRDKKHALRLWDKEEGKFLLILACVALPLTILGGYLQYTHNLRLAADGSYHVGQSTYGDLMLHTAIITSIRDAAFPVDYNILPGELLSYPFLTDSLSTSLYLFGLSLPMSLTVPGTLMMFLCFTGYILVAREMAGSKRAVILASLLFFLNGGLGFLYTFDLAGGDFLERVRYVMGEYYKTPTNQPDPYNLRWSNAIADLMIPQRTLLGGWTMVLPCLYLLYAAFSPFKQENKAGIRHILLLGIWAGGLPMIHTHSFLALGLMSGGFLLYTLLKKPHEDSKNYLLKWLLYGAAAVLLAVPQLFFWTFSQATGSGHFLQFQFNWVNNSNNNGLIDMYLWFYIKNIGLPVILLMCALLEKNPKHRFLAAGAFMIFLAAEFIRFQPNEYDNNKLFYIWYMIGAILAADYAVIVFDRLRGLRSRYLLAAFTAVAFFLSAGLTLAREVVSDYEIMPKESIDAAKYIEETTPNDAVFMTGYAHHRNLVSSLAGRTIVSGPDLWLYYHGFDTSERKYDIERFYQDPQNNLDVLSKYQVDYVCISSYERNDLTIDYAGLETLFPLTYTSEMGDISLYTVPKEYRESDGEG